MTDAPAVRIGVLGAARIADIALVQPAHEHAPQVRLVAVAARDQGRAEAFASQHGFERVVPDYAALVTDPEVDVVYNPLPNAMHAPWNILAMQAGKDVFTEKPSTGNAAEARQVRDVVGQTGVRYMEAFHYRYHPVIARAIEIVGSGEIGDVVRIESRTVIDPPAPDDLRWSYALAGGAIMDIGTYSLHIQRTLGAFAGGEPTLVSARATEGPARVDAQAEMELAFPSGATGLATCDMTGEAWDFTARVIGSRGEVFIHRFVDPHEDNRLTVTVDGRSRVERHGDRTTFAYQFDALLEYLAGRATVPTDVDDATRHMELIDEVYEATGLGVRPSRREESGS